MRIASFLFHQLNLKRIGRHTGRLSLVAIFFIICVNSSPAQINLIIEEGAEFEPGSFVSGKLGIPSISRGNYGGSGWDLAVKGGLAPTGGNATDYVLYFSDSDAGRFKYDGNGTTSIVDDRPSVAFDSIGPVYLDNNLSTHVYHGSNQLGPFDSSNLFVGRPSAWQQFFAHFETDVSNSKKHIVFRDPNQNTGRVVVDIANTNFTDIGMLGPGFANDISFGRGGSGTVVFRGHNSDPAQKASNGIFVKQVNFGSVLSVVDNTTHSLFDFGTGPESVLPVAHGQGAAWVFGDDQAVLARPTLRTADFRIATDPSYSYGNVSSGSGGLLVYEKTPRNGQQAGETQIWMNLVGQNMLCVERSMIPGAPVLDLSMGSEAFASNFLILGGQNTSNRYHALAFHAVRNNPIPEDAIYVKSIDKTGVDVCGRFNGTIMEEPVETAFFTVGNGGCADCPPIDKDYLTLRAHNSTGEALPLGQNYGVSLGVDSGGTDDPFLLNSITQGGTLVSESASINLDYDIYFNTLLFTDLDLMETVRIGVDGVFTEVTYDGTNQENFIEGIQGIVLDPPIQLPSGSTLTIEHGGNGDGFGLVSFVMSPASDECYLYDDGQSENNIGHSASGDFLWGNYFDEMPGNTLITSLRVAFGEFGVPVGYPFQVAIYDDLDDDGDPTTNLQLVASVSGTVDNPGPVGLDVFQIVDVPDVTISGGFFVAAYMDGTNNPFPAMLDTTTTQERSWFAEHDAIGALDISDPFGTATLSGLIDDFGFPGNFLVRADCSNSQTDCLLGDVNQDGVVDLLDVSPFVEIITSGDFFCEADINEDATVDLLDVAPFVALLTGG